MKALCLSLALFWGASAFAGGAIGGSTGSKCSEFIALNRLEFQRLVHEALTKGELVFRGEVMQVEALNMDEQIIQMRSMIHRDLSIIWYVDVSDWDAE
jgi:hypothetical protein